ncbi:hypothetical protein TpMuguga_04g00526 [Theileria parva strain Muguga]|uniref:C3H1-type domain-containing protein n=1 Tax=Theileria parva TaxID=5875 RepID=Q4N3L6_THEPA|nr:uncharacterized protein TpMuguga_04g00526 [Theileria parva strain Muguga]EAN31878.1 hypothetical protein TpMuguga_04g00526 [Theileria parva strain Muguga]|eukprot:XP_764161.1 hypothetical protein [Theileria parva strain Muguga]
MEHSFSNGNRSVYAGDLISSEPQINFNINRLYEEEGYTAATLNLNCDVPELNCVDRFSTILLSKSELDQQYERPSKLKEFNGCLSRTSSFEPLERVDDMSNVTFFRDLKHYFTNSLIAKLKKLVNHLYKNDVAHYTVHNDYIVLTTNEFRDRALFILKYLSSSETNIVHLLGELRNCYKVIETSAIPSIGSILHSNGYCKPCVFANKKTNYCKTGFGCNFCHYNHKLSKSKGTTKTYAKLSTDSDFFKKLIRSPRSPESSTLISTTPEDSFSVVSSIGSLSISDHKSRNDFSSQLLTYSHSDSLTHENGKANGFLETRSLI